MDRQPPVTRSALSDDEFEVARAEVAVLLPVALHRAVESYRRFAVLRVADPDDPKAFAAHHAACKSALQHLETLAKLARWATDTGEDGADADDAALARMVRDARTALAGLPAHPEDDAP